MNMQLPQAINTTDDEIDLSELFSVLWHKKWLIIFITLSCFAFALVVIERMPNVYRSTATVLLHNEGDNNALKALLPGANGNSVDFDTSIRLLTSKRFLGQVVKNVSIPKQLREQQVGVEWGASQLHQGLSIKQVSKTDLLEVSFESIDANFSSLIVNAITVSFIQYQADLMQPKTKSGGDWIDQKMAQVKTALAREELHLNNFRHQNSAMDIANLVKEQQREISILFQEHKKLAKEKASLTRVLHKMAQLKNSALKMVAIPRVSEVNIIKGLLQLLANQATEFSQIKLRYLNKHPKYQVMLLKINETKLQLSSQLQYLVEKYEARLREVNYLDQEMLHKQKHAKRELEQAIIKFQEFEQIDRNIKANVGLLKTLTSRQKELQVLDDTHSIASFIIVDPALVPSSPIKPKKMLLVVLALLLGLMIAVIIVFLLHFMQSNRSRYRQIVMQNNFRVLGELPNIKHSNGKQPILDSRCKNFANYQESIRSIRTNLLIDKSLSQQRLVAVTSLNANEGKSSFCLQLAKSFSELQRVIIIDADLRSPSIALALGQSPHRLGLSNILAQTHSAQECIFKSDKLNVDVLSSGIRPNNALLFLSCKRFSDLLAALLKKYDRVILECPPLLSVSDAVVIGKSVSGLTLVVDVTQHTASKLNNEMAQLQHSDIDINGIILNRSSNKAPQYYSAYSAYTEKVNG